VFEGIRLYPTPHGPAIFRLKDHVERLYRGARTYGLDMPYPAERFGEIIVATRPTSGRSRSSAAIRCVSRRGTSATRTCSSRCCRSAV
jgi:branched-subunit amino acid aminotransferase/4-amino-4-deoxychorismate lyase